MKPCCGQLSRTPCVTIFRRARPRLLASTVAGPLACLTTSPQQGTDGVILRAGVLDICGGRCVWQPNDVDQRCHRSCVRAAAPQRPPGRGDTG
jgi:hypothetical protein